MFPSRYFCNRYFAPRYWPKVGGTPVAVTDTSQSSFVSEDHFDAHVRRHHYPESGSHIGTQRRAFFHLVIPGLSPAGA
jgi:hypothetical protein